MGFLGFVLRQRPDAGVSVRLQSDNIQRFRARMQETLTLYDAGAIEAGDKLDEVLYNLNLIEGAPRLTD